MEGFIMELLNDLKALLGPFIVLLKGIGQIIGKIFTFIVNWLGTLSS
jgi:hypothetical protein